MTEHHNQTLDSFQLAALRAAFHQGSADASLALARWIGKPSVVKLDSLDQLPLADATALFSDGSSSNEQPVCFCACSMTGILTGEILLVFDDPSGMALADLLLDQDVGTTCQWTDWAKSAALETTNILCCAFFNSLLTEFSPDESAEEFVLLPSPPTFSREYAESLLQFALMGQAMASDQVLLAKTKFEIDGKPIQWTLLLIPDAESMDRLPKLITTA